MVNALGNTANVVTADVAISNGVVHVIDGVLLPEYNLPNVVEAATAANLSVLLDAVTAANLGQTLSKHAVNLKPDCSDMTLLKETS